GMSFFDDSVHDSRAWSTLIPIGNPDREAGMKQKLISMIARRNEENRKGVVAVKDILYLKLLGPIGDHIRRKLSPPLTQDELRAISDYENTGQIPRM
ncbi:hypothetical protein D0817_26010, partial [Flavobacterium cupreum]